MTFENRNVTKPTLTRLGFQGAWKEGCVETVSSIIITAKGTVSPPPLWKLIYIYCPAYTTKVIYNLYLIT